MIAPGSRGLLEINDVAFAYNGAPVLDGVSVEFHAGRMYGVAGPNGAGKSTLLRVALGLLAPQRGTALLNGKPVRSMARREVARTVAYLPQEAPAAGAFRVMEMALMGRHARLGALEFESARDVECAQQALRATGAWELRGRMFATLSGGEKQAVLLARALAQETPVIVLDEPTTFLDVRNQVAMYETLARRCEAGGTVIAVTHDLNLAGQFCSEMILLKQGRVAARGAPGEVLRGGVVESVFDAPVHGGTDAQGRPFIVPRRRNDE